jgi:hypothetical protein
MTLNLAYNFLRLPFVIRFKVLKELELLNEAELKSMASKSHDNAHNMYKLAFNRANKSNKIKALEKKVLDATAAL